MSKNREKIMLDLQRLLASQNFQSREELEKFMDTLKGRSLDETPSATPEGRAQDLVYEAREIRSGLEADKKIFSALKLDPECVEAFEFMAEVAVSPLQSLVFYRNGMNAGRRKLGEKFFEENKGHFWLVHETRPFMRCMFGYAMTLYELDEKQAALDLFKEILALNPNDNQGARDYAMLYSLDLSQPDVFDEVQKSYPDDQSTFTLFNRTLYLFKKEGDTPATREILQQARLQNAHVIALLMSDRTLPPAGNGYIRGDKSEAVYYATVAREVWHNTPGAQAWLNNVYRKK
jgi:tetratricopeptide (TPR) repeat protein